MALDKLLNFNVTLDISRDLRKRVDRLTLCWHRELLLREAHECSKERFEQVRKLFETKLAPEFFGEPGGDSE